MNRVPELLEYEMGHGVRAFSTTRRGGYSVGPYAGFNINHYCGDDEAAIAKNRQALCSMLGITDDRLIMPHQVHLTKLLRIDEAFLALQEEERLQLLEGVDAVMTDVPGVCIGVSTADCIPLLLYDEEHQAICAVHAGWRGTVARITEKAVAAMKTTYGTRPEKLRAQIGPGISLESFEVGNEVYEAFSQAGFDMNAISKRPEFKDSPLTSHPSPLTTHLLPLTSKWHIDLPECNRLQLISAGVVEHHITLSHICTYQECDTYFSARRLGINSGRIYTGILL